MSDNKTKKPKNYSIIFVAAGVLGIIGTAAYLVGGYKSSNNMQELMKPLIYMFVPFVISFALFKTGINGLVNKKK
jgi:uncharacterized membrane protein